MFRFPSPAGGDRCPRPRRSLARILLLLALAGGWLGAVSPAGAAPGEARQRLQEFYRQVRSLSARFEQRVTEADGVPGQRASGRFYLQRPGRFRWDYQDPYRQVIVSDGEKLWVYDEDLEQVTVQPVAEALDGTPAAVLAGDRPLEEQFAILELPPAQGLEWVELRPLEVRSDFAVVRLGLGETLEVIELEDRLGQRTRIRFDELRLNPALDPALFRFRPPPGVEVVESAGDR